MLGLLSEDIPDRGLDLLSGADGGDLSDLLDAIEMYGKVQCADHKVDWYMQLIATLSKTHRWTPTQAIYYLESKGVSQEDLLEAFEAERRNPAVR